MRATETQPLVVVVSSVPLLAEAIAATLAQQVRVAWFPPVEGDLEGLLRSLRADAVVVDSADAAEAAASLAGEDDLPVLEIALARNELRVLRGGAPRLEADASADSIRNALAAALFGKEALA